VKGSNVIHEWLIVASEYAITAIDIIALVVIVFGTLQAALGVARAMFATLSGSVRREIWLQYARWLVAGLTFQLAADIIETAITTDWEAIGRVAAVAVIRTFLNYFLERDMAEARERSGERRATDAHAEH
jgi:uncharacterized membrane protein